MKPALAERTPLRVLGTYEGEADGPTVIVTGAMHGNEPAGVLALETVLETLHSRHLAFRGRLVGVVGNRSALRHRRRYLTRDLNRRWEPDLLMRLRRADHRRLIDEDREQRELLDLFEPYLAAAKEPVVFLDLHSTSGHGAPFVCMADVIRNRKVAFDLRIPVVLGLEETIQGSMLGYLCDLGHIGVAVEGGQHDDPKTVAHHCAAVWSVLGSAGAVELEAVPDYPALKRKLCAAIDELPSVIEITHRHVCVDGDGFVMQPGYTNFQAIAAGERVAQDQTGDIRAPMNGIMMLPRYQGQGEDGYFVARPVRSLWLRLSAQLRRIGADRVLRGMPGVTRHPDRPDHFLVDQRIARLRAIELFHLLGYRRAQPEGKRLVFSRRRPDEYGPEPLPPVDEDFPTPLTPARGR